MVRILKHLDPSKSFVPIKLEQEIQKNLQKKIDMNPQLGKKSFKNRYQWNQESIAENEILDLNNRIMNGS